VKEETHRDAGELASAWGFEESTTANQRRHYFERGGVRGWGCVQDGVVTRGNLFCRRNLPTARDRIIGSRTILRRVCLIKSRSHGEFAGASGTEYIDSFVLHALGISMTERIEVWQAMRGARRGAHAIDW